MVKEFWLKKKEREMTSREKVCLKPMWVQLIHRLLGIGDSPSTNSLNDGQESLAPVGSAPADSAPGLAGNDHQGEVVKKCYVRVETIGAKGGDGLCDTIQEGRAQKRR